MCNNNTEPGGVALHSVSVKTYQCWLFCVHSTGYMASSGGLYSLKTQILCTINYYILVPLLDYWYFFVAMLWYSWLQQKTSWVWDPSPRVDLGFFTGVEGWGNIALRGTIPHPLAFPWNYFDKANLCSLKIKINKILFSFINPVHSWKYIKWYDHKWAVSVAAL